MSTFSSSSSYGSSCLALLLDGTWMKSRQLVTHGGVKGIGTPVLDFHGKLPWWRMFHGAMKHEKRAVNKSSVPMNRNFVGVGRPAAPRSGNEVRHHLYSRDVPFAVKGVLGFGNQVSPCSLLCASFNFSSSRVRCYQTFSKKYVCNHSLRMQINNFRVPSNQKWSSTSTLLPSRAGRGTGNGKHKRWSSTWLGGALLLAPPVLAAYLGNWQLQRHDWKKDLLQRRQRIISEDPRDAFAKDSEAYTEYQPVFASGTFDEEKTQFVGPRPRSIMGITEAGYLAITPFKDSGSEEIVLVLRGWVPASWKTNDPSRDSNNTSTNMNNGKHMARFDIIHGIVRCGEDQRSSFVPENRPDIGEWHYIDPKSIAAKLGLPESTLFIEIIDAENISKKGRNSLGHDLSSYSKDNLGKLPTTMEVLGGRRVVSSQNDRQESKYPISKTQSDLLDFKVTPQDHLNYALTWFALSAATTYLAFKALRRSGR